MIAVFHQEWFGYVFFLLFYVLLFHMYFCILLIVYVLYIYTHLSSLFPVWIYSTNGVLWRAGEGYMCSCSCFCKLAKYCELFYSWYMRSWAVADNYFGMVLRFKNWLSVSISLCLLPACHRISTWNYLS